MERIGIIGFPNVGKTALFNALTGLDAPTAPHPFATIEPNLGVASVPDVDLDRAAEFERSKKVGHAALELLDLPSMSKPGHGSGLGGQFLGRLREMDALAVVLRAFSASDVPSDESGVDPVDQAEELGLELVFADSEVFSRRAEKIAKEATADPSKRAAAAAIEKAAALLEAGTALRSVAWTEEEQAAFRDLAPLTLQPTVWVINVDEDDVDHAQVGEVSRSVPEGDVVVALSARLEEEGSRLAADERAELFDGLGLGEGALATMVGAAYTALGLISFYTIGPKESRAWTVQRGTSARAAAGKIHSDLERGFIRAEVVPMDVVLDAGGWDAAKASGHIRVEGRDYVVQESDVVLVRFSV